MPYIYREQKDSTIPPIPSGLPIAIPVKIKDPTMIPGVGGSVTITETGTYIANWNIPVTRPGIGGHVVIGLYNATTNEVVGISGSNITAEGIPGNECAEIVSGSAIFKVDNANDIIQLINYSPIMALPIIIPVTPGIIPYAGGATFTIYKID
ncbi:MAG: hypothetical protein ACRDD7_02555 [Peptostreptococcaceae bacterium]